MRMRSRAQQIDALACKAFLADNPNWYAIRHDCSWETLPDRRKAPYRATARAILKFYANLNITEVPYA